MDSKDDERIKLTMLFNIGIFQDDKRYLLKELKAPVAYFNGGPKDVGFENVSYKSRYLTFKKSKS